MTHNPDLPRCGWVSKDDELYCNYHDTEWGVPNYDSKSFVLKINTGRDASGAFLDYHIAQTRHHIGSL